MSVEFVDTNVLVYAHDRSAKAKYPIARDLLGRLFDHDAGGLSIQVLCEFFAVATRKLAFPLSVSAATHVVEDYSKWVVHCPQPSDVGEAIRLFETHRLSFWDAMIVNSARSVGAKILWTEDLQDGRKFGSLKIRNPFA